ncbi:MAG: CHAD domain-containing protein [Vicinamibacterales bacterium]
MARRSLIDALLAPRIAALLDTLPAALDGEVEAVHRARVSSRRLRELLPPLGHVVAHDVADAARAEVRRVTRALGPVRELDVSIGLFDELAAAHALGAPARLAVRRTLTRDRDAALGRLRTAMSPRRRGRLARALAALQAAEAAAAAGAAGALLAAVDARAVRRAERVRTALHRAGAMYVPERLHQIRIAVKQLRYALEVAGAARRSRATARVTQLRTVQDLLGHAHDLHVLADRIRDVQTHVVRTSRTTVAALDAFVAHVDEACRADHAAFMSRRAALLALCDSLDPAAAPPRRRSVA